ncbi:MAG: hypothetical protein KDA75_09755, partial [Planctomycetaceae bacterium]|nr:hypothetical protein [Planctomycetaceae bacterium]
MSQATAHPGGHGSEDSAGSRAWTIAATGTHVHGTFVAVAEGRVQLRRDDGSLSSLSIDWLSETDRNWVNERMAEIERINSRPVQILAQRDNEPAKPRPGTNKSADAPVIRQHFRPFDESLQLRWDDRYFYVESNGLPDHPMMIGITAWQQQVPLPQ